MVFGSGSQKAASAGLDELRQQVQDLKTEMEASQTKLEGFVERMQGSLEQLKKSRERDVQALQASLAESANDAASKTKKCVETLSARIAGQFLELEERQTAHASDIGAAMAKLDSDIRRRILEESNAISTRCDEELVAMKEDIMEFFKEFGEDIANSMLEQRTEIDSCINEIQQVVEFNVQQLAENPGQSGGSSLSGEKSVIDTRSSGSQYSDLVAEFKQLKDSVMLGGSGKPLGAEHSEERLSKLEAETTRLTCAMSEVENLATKRVHWVIKNASDLKCASDSADRLHTSWFSPTFDACGCHGLQLELQLFRPDEDADKKQELGNLAAFLWACKGMTIAFRLSIGSKSTALEKTFNGRVSCGTSRCCWLNEEIDASDNTLTVAIEILETLREIEHPIQASPLPEETPERHIGDIVASTKISENAMEGSLFFKRHISNRELEQVRKEVEIMRSRMIRKIDWRVQKASSLRHSFTKNKAVCSSHFNAAGIEGFQFVFYPCGYSSATNGYCSLYVYGPLGATVRCFLSLGKQRRQISHTFNEPGAFGRTNFVSWEENGVIEADDTILIRLEVEEAHQDMHLGNQADGSSETAGAESLLKLVRSSSKRDAPTAESVAAAPGLENHLVLPSLWTSNRLGDQKSPRDQFHRFDELPVPKPSETSVDTPTVASSGLGQAGEDKKSTASTVSKSSSAATLSANASSQKRPTSAAALRRRG